MMRMLLRGLAAGAAGTTALNAATFLDMVLRGRPSSETPEQSVAVLLDKAGVQLPGGEDERGNRLSGLGSLGGSATGLGVGFVAALSGVRRLPLLLSAALLGAAAMAATDVGMARLGVSDPSSWSGADWLADALPHAAYGLAAAGTLRL
jgi:hypothetical protein